MPFYVLKICFNTNLILFIHLSNIAEQNFGILFYYLLTVLNYLGIYFKCNNAITMGSLLCNLMFRYDSKFFLFSIKIMHML